jgi:hypothetical protein
MKKQLFIVTASFLLSAGLYSCKTQKGATSSTVNCSDLKPSYTADIKPILDENCGNSCHSAANRAGGIDLSSYEGAKSVAEKKKFLGAIRHELGYIPMPKKHPKLDDETIRKIACWVQNGSAE